VTKKPSRSRADRARFRGGKGPARASSRSFRGHLRSSDLAGVFSAVGEAAYEWHIDTDTLRWSANAPEVLGVRDLTMIATGRAFAALLDASNTETPTAALMQARGTGADAAAAPFHLRYCLGAATRGSRHWLEDRGRFFTGADGRPVLARGVIRTISTPGDAGEPAIAANSAAWISRNPVAAPLHAAIEEAARLRTSCGFMLVAIDGLSRINEGYGYDIADEVIRAVGTRLRTRMRAEDTLAPIAGSKFGIVLKSCTPDDMAHAAERFLASVRDNIIVTAAGPVPVTVSIGGVTAPRQAVNVHEVLARAQEALDRAKAKRPGSFIAYQPNIEREAIRRENMKVTDKIVAALNERRIALAYEPIVETQSRRPAFFECLMRICRADGTVVPANRIVPIAERFGLVRLLDQRVLELAVAELAENPELQLSLNVSPASTTDADWWSRLAALLRTNRQTADRLIIEITETAAIHNLDDTRGFVTRVKDLGVRIAIDDFGAGYTSFRNLRKLGVDIIKIDGEFVQNMVKSHDDRTFVRTMLQLGQGLGLKTVAEWVQDEASAALLKEWGCDFLQGELVGRASLDSPWRQAPGRIVRHSA
jgi:diguanylate cyclase (GGDEF)-like protein